MKHERSLGDTAPPVGGMLKELSSSTPLAGSAAKMYVMCLHCETGFFRFASHVRRRGKNYCSVGCKNEGKKVRMHTKCVVCSKDMEQTPSDAARVITCSQECSSQRKRTATPKSLRGRSEYKEVVAKTAAIGICCKCEQTNGPWVVAGLTHEIDESRVRLFCRKCHLDEIRKLADAAKKATPEGLEKAANMLRKHGFKVELDL